MITSVNEIFKEALKRLLPEKSYINVLKEEFKFSVRNPVISEGYTSSLAWNGKKFISGLKRKDSNSYLFEGVKYEFDTDELGGILVFSTDVNAVIDQMYPGKSVKDKLKRAFLKVYETFKNRLLRNEKITSILRGREEVEGFSIGNFFKGRFYDRSQNPPRTYDENSLSVEIIGISFDLLQALATEICREFKQDSVLLKDNGSGRILLVNAE